MTEAITRDELVRASPNEAVLRLAMTGEAVKLPYDRDRYRALLVTRKRMGLDELTITSRKKSGFIYIGLVAGKESNNG